MTKAREIADADFGTIKVPEPPKKAEAERLMREQREAFATLRLWKEGSATLCPTCGRRSFVSRSDLSHEVARPGGVVIFRHVRGAKCSHCGAQALEPAEIIAIEAEVGIGQVADYEAKVSNIGSGTVGTYWPKDVVRVMNLNPDTKAFIQVLDRETALIKFVRGHGPRKNRRRSARVRADTK
ncbi:MAG: hypothetical protein ACYDDF_10905 [Thermoplasmatota archaeon]